MNVYITGMPGVSASTINDTIRFLNKSQGRLTFIKSEGISEKQLCRVLKTENSIESFDFCQLEDISDVYRTLREIEDEDLVVFLSDYKLDYEKYDGDKRWFSYFSNNNIVVKTYGWEVYTSNRPYLAISHQIIENVFQSLSGLNLKTSSVHNMYHFGDNSVCINNFALFEKEIKIKLLSGVICETCVSDFLNRTPENYNYYPQIDDILERVRKELKAIVRIEPSYEDVKINEDGSIEIGEHKLTFKGKYEHYIYLFFLINSGKWFSEKNLFEFDGIISSNLNSLIKCHNIVYGHGFTPPDSKPIPKLIQRRIDDIKNKKSTFNSYRSSLSKSVPDKQYGFMRLPNGNNTYRFSVTIPTEKLHLPNSFLGFMC